MIVEIVNWEKYNPRKDLKTSSWFRLENNFCTHHELFDYTNDQKMVWIYLMCEASKSQSPSVTINANLVATLLRIDASIVTDTIQSFENTGLVTLRTRNARVTRTTRTRNTLSPARVASSPACNAHVSRCRPTDGRTDGRDERTDITDDTDSACARVDPQSSFGKFSPKELAQIWNELSSPKQPKVDLKRFSSGSKRWESAIARLKKDPDPEYWRSVITRLAASDFCNGESSSGWIANFDFLVSRDGHLKIMEGRYDNRAKPTYGAETCRVITEETNLDELC